VTSTVRGEVESGLLGYINRMLDKGQISLYVPRGILFSQARARFKQLCSKIDANLRITNPKFAEAKRFYSEMARKPDQRLVDNMRQKGRASLMPSDVDLALLGEAARLAETEKTALVTNDVDFTSFEPDILRCFDVKVVNLRNMPSDETSVDRTLKKIELA